MDRTSFDFQFEFLALYLCKQSSTVLLSNDPLLDFVDLVNFKSPVLSNFSFSEVNELLNEH